MTSDNNEQVLPVNEDNSDDGLDSLLDSLLEDIQLDWSASVALVVTPDAPDAPILNDSSTISQEQLYPNLIALELCKIYMNIFTANIISRLGVHYPMAAFFVNNGRFSLDITIAVPDPVKQQALPSFTDNDYSGY